jgi:citrate lyase beta subunit
MSAIKLGATLYVPALHPNLVGIVRGGQPGLRSMVICLEDAIREDDVERARARFVEVLGALRAEEIAVRLYVRPRDIAMLVWILGLRGIERLDGFVLPKVTAHSLPHWLGALIDHPHGLMPTVEGEEAFDRDALARMRDQLIPFGDRVHAVRIGGNDILNVLGVRRSKLRTAYEGPLGPVIRDVAGAFLPHGIAVAAPVFEHYGAPEVLRREVEQDIEHGLLTKTAIHPNQLAVIHDCYRPSVAEMREARTILSPEADAVFGSAGSMCEPATHSRWAGFVIERAQVYGVEHDICDVDSRVA